MQMGLEMAQILLIRVWIESIIAAPLPWCGWSVTRFWCGNAKLIEGVQRMKAISAAQKCTQQRNGAWQASASG